MDLVDQWGRPLTLTSNSGRASSDASEVAALRAKLAAMEKELAAKNQQIAALEQERRQHQQLTTKLSDKGLIIQDTVTGTWYRNTEDEDGAIILRELKGMGYEGVASVDRISQGYQRWINTLNENPDGLYDLTSADVQKLKTRAQKLHRYLHSTAFLGSVETVFKINMITIISYHPDKFMEAVSQCGGDPERWETYIRNSDDPWANGVLVGEHCIRVHVDATIYSDSAKDYSVTII